MQSGNDQHDLPTKSRANEQSRALQAEHREQFEQTKYEAINGDVRSQNIIGFCYLTGRGVQQNNDLAIQWFNIAATKGDARAKQNLDLCQGCTTLIQIPAKALQLHRAGVFKRDPDALRQTRYWLEALENMATTDNKHIKTFIDSFQAVINRDDNGYNNVGFCYLVGMGISQDTEQAIQWLKIAAEKGSSNAPINLSFCQNNPPLSKIYTNAYNYYTSDDKKNDPEAQISLQRWLSANYYHNNAEPFNV